MSFNFIYLNDHVKVTVTYLPFEKGHRSLMTFAAVSKNILDLETSPTHNFFIWAQRTKLFFPVFFGFKFLLNVKLF